MTIEESKQKAIDEVVRLLNDKSFSYIDVWYLVESIYEQEPQLQEKQDY
jgi:hypothetical protein